MTIRPLKPKGHELHDVLKLLKAGFDDPSLDRYEPMLYREAILSPHPILIAWRGEILHQLALRAERRGDHDRANRLYGLSAQSFDESEYMARARMTRDFAMHTSHQSDPEEGLRLAHEAYELHQGDANNAKGVRQQRVSRGYLLRAQILADEHTDAAIAEIVELALDGCRDFCLRDQQIVVAFARRYAGSSAKRRLDVRQLEIHARRGRVIGIAGSATRLVIDTELMLAAYALRRLTRKE